MAPVRVVCALGGLLALLIAVPAPASTPAPNPIRAENALSGSAGWFVPEAPEPAAEGYATSLSEQPGDTVQLHVSTSPAERYRIQVYRLGWYGGAGGRLVACSPGCSSDEQGQAEPQPSIQGSGLIQPGWPVTDSIVGGSDWTSGYYLADAILTS